MTRSKFKIVLTQHKLRDMRFYLLSGSRGQRRKSAIQFLKYISLYGRAANVWDSIQVQCHQLLSRVILWCTTFITNCGHKMKFIIFVTLSTVILLCFINPALCCFSKSNEPKPGETVISWSRGWCIKFATGLSIKIGIIQRVNGWLSCPFAKLIPPWDT